MNRIVIIGGGYGGVMAAVRLARRGLAVTLIDARDGLVERIRLHQVAAGDGIERVPYGRLFAKLPVQFIQARVSDVDRERRVIHADRGAVAYDTLVFALGSVTDAPPHATSIERLTRDALQRVKSITIAGGGLTGIECASELAERFPHLRITVADANRIAPGLSERARRHVIEWMAQHHVELRENTRIENTSDDILLWCGSFRAPALAREIGLDVNARNQILVDEHLRSSDPSIYAIGDAAYVPGVRMACASALPMGAYVADHLAGATSEPFRMGYVIQCISLGRRDGIVQFVNPDDSPKEKALTGRAAAWVKEMICRFTILSLRLEARGVHYAWPKQELAA